jgi:hypothetical protein
VLRERESLLTAERATAVLEVSSVPAGARVEVDGRLRGETPLDLRMAPGPHVVTLTSQGHGPTEHLIELKDGETTHLAAELWLENPKVRRLRPPLPGGRIANATFLSDGRIALDLALAPREYQLFEISSDGTTARPFGQTNLGPQATSPNGERIAYLASGEKPGLSTDRLDEAWVARPGRDPAAERVFALPAGSARERLSDLAFTPDGRALLLVSRDQSATGEVRFRLRRLDLGDLGDLGGLGGNVELPPARELGVIPSEVLAGSYSFSPDSRRVALLARAGSTTSLCVLGLDSPGLRLVGDVDRASLSALPFPPLDWSSDGGQIVYSAPTDDGRTRGFTLVPQRPSGLFRLDLTDGRERRLAGEAGQFPAWRSDGSVVSIARVGGEKGLRLKLTAPQGGTRGIGQLTIASTKGFGARWDTARGRLIVATQAESFGAGPDLWLVEFTPPVETE